MRPLAGELDESAGQHDESSGKQTARCVDPVGTFEPLIWIPSFWLVVKSSQSRGAAKPEFFFFLKLFIDLKPCLHFGSQFVCR